MLNIGISQQQSLVFEGRSHYGRLVWPSPVITHAKILTTSNSTLLAETSQHHGWRFREDSFDPISRIRRGRFYYSDQGQPQSWFIQPNPIVIFERSSEADNLMYLETFFGRSIYHEFLKNKHEQPLVLLGFDDRFTIWTIINVEVMSTGEELVTLKSRVSLGILPNIDYSKIPPHHHGNIRDSLDTFLNEVYRASPVSVIDRARDAASQILIAFLGIEGRDAKDLGPLIVALEEQKKIIGSNAAKIIARLHARAKPVERQKNQMREVREQDAQLATQCLGTLLCEIGWADWV